MQLLLRKVYVVCFNVVDTTQEGWLSFKSLITVFRLALACSEEKAKMVIESFLGFYSDRDSIITFKAFYKLLLM